jgi:hypothetical protein
VNACVIDWPAFGLELPDNGTGCTGQPIIEITQACVHEHVARAQVCGPCYSEIISYEPDPREWTCGPCVAAGHRCPAPLIVAELSAGTR